MQTKLLIAGVGAASAAVGAVVSWAITADRRDARHAEELENKDLLIQKLRDRIYKLTAADPVPILTNYVGTDSQAIVVDGIKPPTADLKSIKVTSSDLIEQMKVETENPPEEIDSEESEPQQDEDENSDEWEAPIEESPEQTRTNLQNLISRYTQDEGAAEQFANYAGKTFERDYTPPFVISQAEYAWGEDGNDYSKITLAYYPGARVVLDEDDERIDDVPNTIGWRNLNRFGEESGDADTVFVRNRRLLSDFEVVRTDDPLPLHIRYGMPKSEFKAARASGMLKMRPEDADD